MNYKAIYQHLVNATAVTAIVSTRVYHDAPPRNPTLPYIVFRKISGNEQGGVEYGTDRYQIDLIGSLRGTNQSATLETLRNAVVDLLKDFKGTLGSGANVQIVKGTEFGGDTELPLSDNDDKQISLDFLFHYLR